MSSCSCITNGRLVYISWCMLHRQLLQCALSIGIMPAHMPAVPNSPRCWVSAWRVRSRASAWWNYVSNSAHKQVAHMDNDDVACCLSVSIHRTTHVHTCADSTVVNLPHCSASWGGVQQAWPWVSVRWKHMSENINKQMWMAITSTHRWPMYYHYPEWVHGKCGSQEYLRDRNRSVTMLVSKTHADDTDRPW